MTPADNLTPSLSDWFAPQVFDAMLSNDSVSVFTCGILLGMLFGSLITIAATMIAQESADRRLRLQYAHTPHFSNPSGASHANSNDQN